MFFYLTPTGPPYLQSPQFHVTRPELHVFVQAASPQHQLWGVISIPFLGRWFRQARSHWKPLGTTGNHWEPLALLFCHCRRSQPNLQLSRPSSGRPSSIGSGAVIPHSDVFPHTRYPESLKKPRRDKERLFPDCRREERGGRSLKY